MYTFITLLIIIVCVLMILIVLVQSPKVADWHPIFRQPTK